jgi:hypothetical protein
MILCNQDVTHCYWIVDFQESLASTIHDCQPMPIQWRAQQSSTNDINANVASDAPSNLEFHSLHPLFKFISKNSTKPNIDESTMQRNNISRK